VADAISKISDGVLSSLCGHLGVSPICATQKIFLVESGVLG